MNNLKPENHYIGEEFELFSYRLLFQNFEILEKSHDFNEYYPYIKSNDNPDFKFYCQKTSKEFYIECKYYDINTALGRNQISIKTNQYKRYVDSKKENIFYLIGLGINPNEIEFLYLIPLELMFEKTIYQSHLDKFQIPLKQIKNFNELIKLLPENL